MVQEEVGAEGEEAGRSWGQPETVEKIRVEGGKKVVVRAKGRIRRENEESGVQVSEGGEMGGERRKE